MKKYKKMQVSIIAMLSLMLSFAFLFSPLTIFGAEGEAQASPMLTGTLQTALGDLEDRVYGRRLVYGTSSVTEPHHLKSNINDFNIYDDSNTVYIRLTGEYEGFAPDKTYAGTLSVIYPDGSRKEFDAGTIEVNEIGKGSYSIEQSFALFIGENGRYCIELKYTSDGEEVILGGNNAENKYAFVVGGFNGVHGSYVTVPNSLSMYNPYLQIVTPEDGKKGVEFNHEVKVSGLKANTEYVLYDWIREGLSGSNNIGQVSKDFTTDDKGNATIKYSLGIYDNLEPGRYYQVYSAVQQQGSTVYNRYDYNYELAMSSTVVVVLADDNKPQEETTYVDVTIDVLDKDTKSNLDGAKLRIVKVDNEQGETVEEWISDGKEKTFSLPVGTYTLVQDSAPEGYTKEAPQTIEVTADKALTHGDAFAAYTNYATIKNDFQFYEMMFHPYHDITDAKLGYCINLSMRDPSPMDQDSLDRLFYKETLVESDELIKNVTNDKYTADELNAHIKRVIYNGYPTDASGIKNRYGLNDEEFRFITQMAVHHFTDNREWLDEQLDGEKNYIDAYHELINCDKAAPEDMILRVYIAENNKYQSLIAAEFTNDLGVKLEIFNAKEEDEPDKPTKPDTPEKPNEPAKPDIPKNANEPAKLDTPKKTNGPTKAGTPEKSNVPDSPAVADKPSTVVRAGDDTNLSMFVLVLLLSSALASVMVAIKRRRM